MHIESQHRISFPTQLLLQQLSALGRGTRESISCPAGSSRRQDTGLEVFAARTSLPAGSYLRLSTHEVFEPLSTQTLPEKCIAYLQVGRGPLRGRARGWVRSSGVWRPVERLNLPGAHMREAALRSEATSQAVQIASREMQPGSMIRWSRTAGALGRENYARAAGLKIGIVGLGRLGSLLASRLVRFGVRRMVVADPDRVEQHNTGEGEFEPLQEGLLKVHAWTRHITRTYPGLELVPVGDTITSLAAVDALKGCDLLFSVPDQAGARLAAAGLAAAYCRPLIDVGSHVHREGLTSMGADIRLITPERCLLCFGSVARETEGVRLLESPDEEDRLMAFRDWRQERPGSLASLNMTAAGIALRMFEDLVSGRIETSLWCHIEFHENGQLQVSYPTPQARGTSLACACAISGWGDAGPGQFANILRRRQSTPIEVPR